MRMLLPATAYQKNSRELRDFELDDSARPMNTLDVSKVNNTTKGDTHPHDFLPCLLDEAHLPTVWIHVGILLNAALVCPVDLISKHIEK